MKASDLSIMWLLLVICLMVSYLTISIWLQHMPFESVVGMCIYSVLPQWCNTALSYKLPSNEELLMMMWFPEGFAQLVSC